MSTFFDTREAGASRGVAPTIGLLKQRRALTRFRSAVLAFSDDPSALNFARYRAASRVLDETLEGSRRDS